MVPGYGADGVGGNESGAFAAPAFGSGAPEGAETDAPQYEQKLAPGVRGAPQFGQRSDCIDSGGRR